MARWPNASFDREDANSNWIYDHTKWAVSDNNSAYKGGIVKNIIDNKGHGYAISSVKNQLILTKKTIMVLL